MEEHAKWFTSLAYQCQPFNGVISGLLKTNTIGGFEELIMHSLEYIQGAKNDLATQAARNDSESNTCSPAVRLKISRRTTSLAIKVTRVTIADRIWFIHYLWYEMGAHTSHRDPKMENEMDRITTRSTAMLRLLCLRHTRLIYNQQEIQEKDDGSYFTYRWIYVEEYAWICIARELKHLRLRPPEFSYASSVSK